MHDMETTIIAYIPVIHQGYLDVLQRYSTSSTLLVLDNDLVEKLGERRDIRALNATAVAHLLSSLGSIKKIQVLKDRLPPKFLRSKLVALNDSVCRAFVEKHIPPSIPVTFDTAFLRWDKDRVLSITTVNYDRESSSESDRQIMQFASKIGDQSSDWWRQIGGFIIKDGKIILSAYNRHLPNEYAPYFAGDPRDQIPAGEKSEFSSSLHVERILISLAARDGIALKGTDIGVTTFPCPQCAKAIGEAGIKRCYFREGHASLDGEQNLKDKGVEIILVK